jgi:LPXTG-site transpeptidase (sortase) family protein
MTGSFVTMARVSMLLLIVAFLSTAQVSAQPDPSSGAPPIDSPGDSSTSSDAQPMGNAAADAPISNGTAPVRITIPAIGLDADVVPVGTEADGAMSAPENPDTVGWYSLGPGIGIGGNVVLAGHVDWGGSLRAFGSLRRVTEGDSITVWNAKGDSESYSVESSDWVEADGAPVDEIFGNQSAPTVTLITCGGTFDPWARQYLHRLIVRAHRTAAG